MAVVFAFEEIAKNQQKEWVLHAVLYQLSYEDPYIGSKMRAIREFHLSRRKECNIE